MFVNPESFVLCFDLEKYLRAGRDFEIFFFFFRLLAYTRDTFGTTNTFGSSSLRYNRAFTSSATLTIMCFSSTAYEISSLPSVTRELAQHLFLSFLCSFLSLAFSMDLNVTSESSSDLKVNIPSSL